MSLTEDDLQEVINALEEAQKQKALKKQLKALKIDSNQEEKSSESVWKGEDSQIKMNREDKDDHDSNSLNQDSLKHSNVRLKREKIRENLRKVDLEQKFKNKRIFEPVMSELKEVEKGEEDSQPQKQEQVTKIQQREQEEENVLNEVQEEDEQKNYKETQKKRRTKSRK